MRDTTPNKLNKPKCRLLNGVMDRLYHDPDTYQKRRIMRGRGKGKPLEIDQ